MAEVKELLFQSSIAFEEWKKRTKGKVEILSVSTPEIIIGYDVSQALITPNIRVTYREFSI